MTFAHEVGHNLGAEHDEDAGCSSGYIMSESGSTKISHRDQEFSTCSFEAIHKTLDDVRRIYGRVRSKCFQHRFQTIDDGEFSSMLMLLETIFIFPICIPISILLMYVVLTTFEEIQSLLCMCTYVMYDPLH